MAFCSLKLSLHQSPQKYRDVEFHFFPEEKDVFVEFLNFHSLSLTRCYWQAWPAFPVLTEECQVAAKDGKEEEGT